MKWIPVLSLVVACALCLGCVANSHSDYGASLVIPGVLTDVTELKYSTEYTLKPVKLADVKRVTVLMERYGLGRSGMVQVLCTASNEWRVTYQRAGPYPGYVMHEEFVIQLRKGEMILTNPFSLNERRVAVP